MNSKVVVGVVLIIYGILAFPGFGSWMLDRAGTTSNIPYAALNPVSYFVSKIPAELTVHNFLTLSTGYVYPLMFILVGVLLLKRKKVTEDS